MIIPARLLRSAIVFLVMIGVTGCTSVKVSMPGLNNDKKSMSVVTSERVALVTASQDLANNPWSAGRGEKMMSVLFGKREHNARNKVVAEYLSSIPGTKADKASAVMADADLALAQARRVAEAGRLAVKAITPRDSDIDMLEAAIGDVRECRLMYVRALENLSDIGAPITRVEIRTVRDAFTQTVNDIGATADVVATRIRASKGHTRVASPNRLTEPDL